MKASSSAAFVGVAEHGNAAVLVTVTPTGKLIDRRRIALTEGLPTHPYHHEGAWAVGRYVNSPWAKPITLPEAIALIRRVHAAAEEGARAGLAALAADVTTPIAGLALRVCPPLPDAIEARLADNRAQTMADSILYRQALASAAEARGWSVHWYEPERVFHDAAAALGEADIAALLQAMGRSAGPPWQAKHKLAAAAAIAASAALARAG